MVIFGKGEELIRLISKKNLENYEKDVYCLLLSQSILLLSLLTSLPPSLLPLPSLPSFPPSVYTSASLSVCHFQSRKC